MEPRENFDISGLFVLLLFLILISEKSRTLSLPLWMKCGKYERKHGVLQDSKQRSLEFHLLGNYPTVKVTYTGETRVVAGLGFNKTDK